MRRDVPKTFSAKETNLKKELYTENIFPKREKYC